MLDKMWIGQYLLCCPVMRGRHSLGHDFDIWQLCHHHTFINCRGVLNHWTIYQMWSFLFLFALSWGSAVFTYSNLVSAIARLLGTNTPGWIWSQPFAPGVDVGGWGSTTSSVSAVRPASQLPALWPPHCPLSSLWAPPAQYFFLRPPRNQTKWEGRHESNIFTLKEKW